MTQSDASPEAANRPPGGDEARYVAWFHELDAWTEYWDIYHPETRGRYYFGDNLGEPGLLTRLLMHKTRPPAFVAWTRMALDVAPASAFLDIVRSPDIAEAVTEVDQLLARLFAKHFGDAADPRVCEDYLEAIFRFATDTLPPATERDARIAADDPRKRTAARHTLDGDIMWFSWALQIEAAQAVAGMDAGYPRRALSLAGVAMGCPVDFAWHGHRRTREDYRADDATAALLRRRGRQWIADFPAAAAEIHALFRIREWGHE